MALAKKELFTVCLTLACLGSAVTDGAGGDPVPVPHWAVKVKCPAEFGCEHEKREQLAGSIAARLGLINLGRLEPFEDIYKFGLPLSHGSRSSAVRSVAGQVSSLDRQLSEHTDLVWASKQVPLIRTKRTAHMSKSSLRRTVRGVPPAISFNDPQYSSQWHLVNDQEVGNDINVTAIWSHNITGSGVVIAVVDDGPLVCVCE